MAFHRIGPKFLTQLKQKKVKKAISYLIKYGIPLLIGVGLMYFLYKNVDVNSMMETLKTDVDYWWFGAVAIVSIMSHVFRALRWRLQLNAINVKVRIIEQIHERNLSI